MRNLKASFVVVFFGLGTFLLIIPVPLLIQASNSGQELRISSFSAEMKGTNLIVNAMISDEEGNPLPGVTVTFRDIKGQTYMVPVDSSGHFRINIDRHLLYKQIRLRVELQGFKSSEFSYDLPMPMTKDLPVPRKKDVSIPPGEPTTCDTQLKVLKDGQGINFGNNEIVQKDQSDEYDICFQGEFFYAKKEAGGIATVGDKGTQRLCYVNYPEEGYADSIRVVDNHVYMFVSKLRPLRAEIRVLFFKEKEKVTISYHVR